MCWVWGLGSPAAEMESPDRFLGQPEPEGGESGMLFPEMPFSPGPSVLRHLLGLPDAPGPLPSARLAWTPHLEYGAVERPQEK